MLHDRMEAQSRLVLNDGCPTRPARDDQSAGICSPYISQVGTVMAVRFSWEAITEVGSDHLPLLTPWDRDIEVERVHTGRRPNYPTADWPHFHKNLHNSIHAVLSVGSLT